MAAKKGGVRVEGVREVQAALKKLELEAVDLKATHLAVATAIAPGAAQRSPRRTGALAASWRPGATKGRARITSTVKYAGPIEYGWPARGIEPARMIRDTIEANSAEILETYSREIERLGKREGFKAE